jgi:membrane-associated phospholipid phosphatase
VRWGKARRSTPVLLGLAALAVGLTSAQGRGQRLDRRLYGAINRDHGAVVDGAAKALTELGSIWASAAAAVTLAAGGRRREALDAFGAAALMWGVGQVLKKVWARPRPYEALEEFRLQIARPRGSSWPSSHPAVLLAFLTVAARDLDVSPAARMGTVGLAGAVGATRVILGVHYPADVAGGLLLGRGVADLWTGLVSPRLVGAPTLVGAGTVAP